MNQAMCGSRASSQPVAHRDDSTGNVLVVDDEPVVRGVAQKILERFGYSVLTACDGEEGVEVFRQHKDEVDAVLLDMVMPRMGGADAYAKIREICPNAHVILSSGYTKRETIGDLFGQAPIPFIEKPYSPEMLIAKIREVMAS